MKKALTLETGTDTGSKAKLLILLCRTLLSWNVLDMLLMALSASGLISRCAVSDEVFVFALWRLCTGSNS